MVRSFKSFITESFSNVDFDALEKLSVLADQKLTKTTQRYLDSLNVFKQAVERDEISKKDYETCKYDFTHFFEYATENLIYKNPSFTHADREHLGWPELFSFGVSVKKEVEYAKKLEQIYPVYTNYVLEGSKLYYLFKEFKSKIKVKPKKETVSIGGKEVYMKKMASNDAIKLVHDLLKESFDDVRKKLYSTFLKLNNDNFEDVQKLVKEHLISTPKQFGALKKSKNLNHMYMMFYGNYGRLIDNPEQKIEKMTTDTVAMLEDFFIVKNVKKLALIFERKQELKSHKIVSNKVDPNGVLENVMDFEFTDLSKFRIYTKVEYVYNTMSGDPFIRMPTRFTDVILADGSKMSQPSEEKMDKEF